MGYATAIDYGVAGIRNSLAAEFGTWQNPEFRVVDPNANHISVHTKGLERNSPDELFSKLRRPAVPGGPSGTAARP